MKKFVLLLVALLASLSAWADVEINETNFPDDNFRNWLLAQDYGEDGVLTNEEIANITEIDVSEIGTYDLTGIEYFTALTSLNCSNNQLKALDMSHNTALTELQCYNNQLKALDVSHNTALTELNCSINQLEALDVSHNTTLTSLYCGSNQLDTLDVSHNTALTSLDCFFNNIQELDVSHNIALTTLKCYFNQLDTLDVSHNTALTWFDCSRNQLDTLDVSHNTALKELQCQENQLTALDVSHNTSLKYLDCSINQINGVNMEALVASLPTVDVDNNGGRYGEFCVIVLDSGTEQNVIFTSQVTTARGKNWTVLGRTNYWWNEYDGSYPIVSYIDENRETQSHEAIELTGDETSLGAEGQESWYVACDTLNYTQTLTIAGDVHLILADGAVMSIMSIATETAPGGYGINGNEHEETALTIYGQTLDDDTAGHLNINSDYDCIYINGNYAQHGGNVTANSTYTSGIALWNNLTLTGGTLYVTSSKKAIITVENVDILGGKFSAIGGDKGIYTMEGDVTLGWKNADDEITISSLAYDAPRCTMKIVDGQVFVDSVKNIYDSTTPSNTLWALTNVTLRPRPQYTFNSTTGELALLWGEFNKDNKWGDDVTATAVTSVTATSEVSFTGDCSNMFDGFSSCESMDLSDVDTENCNNMSGMFRSCQSLETLDLSDWDTGNVTNMSGMFQFCQSLKTLDLSGWNTSRVAYINGMFQYCRSLETLDLSGWIKQEVFDMKDIFNWCTALKTLDLSGWNTSRVAYMNGMFQECSNLETLDLSDWDTGNVTDMNKMFSNCRNLTTIYVGDGWSTENVTNSGSMFSDCINLVGGMGTTYDADHTDAEYAHIDGGMENPGYFTERKPRYTFNSTTGELALLWGEFNKDNKWGDDVTATAVKSVTATSNVSFTGDCSALFDSFRSCASMDLGDVNTENCTFMNGMFRDCSSLKTLDLSSWDTGRVRHMSRMFQECICLETLDLSGWNTSRVKSMDCMFQECHSLETLDLSDWDTGDVNNMSEMFTDCVKLTTIYVGEGWSTENVTNSSGMFTQCTKLVGGMGTTYDSSHIDAEYAHIDGGVDNPGYLTGLFSITLPESVEHGTLSASQGDKVLVNGDKVINGSTVTLTILPDNGYVLETLTVTIVDANDDEPSGAPKRLRGGSVELTEGENGTYTFQMPAQPVTVNATFKKTKVTGLNDIDAAQPRSGQRYNLMGQPVGKDYRGIVIEDGQKLIVK